MPLSVRKQQVNGEKNTTLPRPIDETLLLKWFLGYVAVCHLKTTPEVEMVHSMVNWFPWLIYDLNGWCNFLIPVQ